MLPGWVEWRAASQEAWAGVRTWLAQPAGAPACQERGTPQGSSPSSEPQGAGHLRDVRTGQVAARPPHSTGAGGLKM